MLYSIPFYPSLVGKKIKLGKDKDGNDKYFELTNRHVLVLGAIIAHSNGKFNCCMASPDTLAEETGFGVERLKNLRGELISAGLLDKVNAESSRRIKAVSITKLAAKLINKCVDENATKNFKNFSKYMSALLDETSTFDVDLPSQISETFSQNREMFSPHREEVTPQINGVIPQISGIATGVTTGVGNNNRENSNNHSKGKISNYTTKSTNSDDIDSDSGDTSERAGTLGDIQDSAVAHDEEVSYSTARTSIAPRVMACAIQRLEDGAGNKLFGERRQKHFKATAAQLGVMKKRKLDKLAKIIVEWGGEDGLLDALLGYAEHEYTKDDEQKLGDINLLLSDQYSASDAANWLSQYIKVELDDEQ